MFIHLVLSWWHCLGRIKRCVTRGKLESVQSPVILSPPSLYPACTSSCQLSAVPAPLACLLSHHDSDGLVPLCTIAQINLSVNISCLGHGVLPEQEKSGTTEVGPRAVTDLTMLVFGRMWKTLELWTRKAIKHS